MPSNHTVRTSIKPDDNVSREDPRKVSPELWNMIIMHLPLGSAGVTRGVNRQFRDVYKYRQDRVSAGLEDSGPYAPNRLPKYCFRWNEIGKSRPIQLVDAPQDNIAEREVKKGYLVSIEPPNHEGITTFHFTRLPSPLTGNTHTWAVDIGVSEIRGWDISPLSELLAVATVDEDSCLQVKLFEMHDGKEYSRYPAPKAPIILLETAKVDLLFTSHRLAAIIPAPEHKIVYVWNWKKGPQPLALNDDLILASAANFIDEYRLLYVTQPEELMVLDLKHGFQLITFKLENDTTAKNIQRSYELNDAQPFRVNHENGIVVVTVERYSHSRMLMIPTETFFTRSDEVKWEKWSKSVMEYPILPGPPPHVFHTHILSLRLSDSGIGSTRVDSTVLDYSLYCRGVLWEARRKRGVNPLAVTHHGGFNLGTVIDDHHCLFPTENGVLVMQPGLIPQFFMCAY